MALISTLLICIVGFLAVAAPAQVQRVPVLASGFSVAASVRAPLSPYWVAPLNPAISAPALGAPVMPVAARALAAVPIAVVPVAAALSANPQSEREQRMRQIIDTAGYHFRTKMEPDTEAFDPTGNTSSQMGLVAPDRRGRPRRFHGLLEASSNLNDSAVDAKRIDTLAKPSSGIESFHGLFLWEIPSSLMTVLVLTAIAAAFARTRSARPLR